jgi:hypothetical protein
MFLSNLLSQTVPAYRLAGGFGIDVLGLLQPVGAAGGGDGLRLYAHADLARPLDLDALFAQPPPARLSRAALSDHLIVARPRGTFISTDELTLSQVRRQEDRCTVDLEITRCESQDGEPAPRVLYVLLCIDVGDRPLQSLTLQFGARRRDVQGSETPLDAPAAPAQTIAFSE